MHKLENPLIVKDLQRTINLILILGSALIILNHNQHKIIEVKKVIKYYKINWYLIIK